jgi:hypothetical protein
MPILPNGLRDNEVAHHQKHQKGEDKESRKSKKMSYILENTHQAPFPWRQVQEVARDSSV